MHQKYTLDKLGDMLCVRFESVTWDEPLLCAIWWPIKIHFPNPFYSHDDPQIGEEMRDLSRGTFFGMKSRRTFQLTNCGATRAIKRIEYRLVPPKSNLPMRWTDGQWHKKTKRLGWQPCGIGSKKGGV
jgi:hypothetical protein